MGGSSLGIGTDIGAYFYSSCLFKYLIDSHTAGSIRVPAAFCGIYGIKPSHNRFSYRGVANTVRSKPRSFLMSQNSHIILITHPQNPGQTLIPSSVGFLSRSLESLELVMCSLLSTSPWLRDPAVVPIPWRKEERIGGEKKLKFGIFWWDGMIQPHPPVTRALGMVGSALKNAGHEVGF